MPKRNNLPPAAVLPEKLIHVSGRTIPGQFAGLMGAEHDPWFVEANRFRTSEYIHGAFPEYGFHRWNGPTNPPNYIFEAPRLTLEHGILEHRFKNRVHLLQEIERQRRDLDRAPPPRARSAPTPGRGRRGRLGRRLRRRRIPLDVHLGSYTMSAAVSPSSRAAEPNSGHVSRTAVDRTSPDR